MPTDVAIIFIISLLTFRLLTTVFHELGHAIPALLFTNGAVTLYLGSHGNPKKSLHFTIGRLEVFFKFNFFYWKGGLCVPHSKNVSLPIQILISLGGPLTSLIVGLVASLFLFYGTFEDVTQMVLVALAFSALFDFIHNITPRETPISLYDGSHTRNDGSQLVYLWKYRTVYNENAELISLFEAQEYEKAAIAAENSLESGATHELIYRIAISSFLIIKQYDKAASIQEVFTEKYNDIFDQYDYNNLAYIQSTKKEHKLAYDNYMKAYELEPTNIALVNNVSYAYSVNEEYEKALEFAEKSIAIDATFSHAWGNKGYTLLKLGKLEEGRIAIQKSIELDDQNSHAYRDLGLYYFLKKDYQEALNYYTIALDKDPYTFDIQEYIKEVEIAIENS